MTTLYQHPDFKTKVKLSESKKVAGGYVLKVGNTSLPIGREGLILVAKALLLKAAEDCAPVPLSSLGFINELDGKFINFGDVASEEAYAAIAYQALADYADLTA